MNFIKYADLFINVDNICTIRAKHLKNDYGFHTIVLSINGVDHIIYNGTDERIYYSEYKKVQLFIADLVCNSEKEKL